MLSIKALLRLTILMGLVTLSLALYKKWYPEIRNVQLGRQTDLPPFKLDQDIVEKKYDGLVQLITADKHKGFCSAVIISNVYAVTAAHCLVDEDGLMKNSANIKVRSIEVVDAEGNKSQLITPIEIVGLNIATDYALLIGDFSEFTSFKVNTRVSAIGASGGTEVLPGVLVPMFAIGFPFGGEEPAALAQTNCQTVGDMLMCQGIMFRGMSGGVLVDPVTGVAVGVNHAIDLGSQATFFKFMIAIFDNFNVETY